MKSLLALIAVAVGAAMALNALVPTRDKSAATGGMSRVAAEKIRRSGQWDAITTSFEIASVARACEDQDLLGRAQRKLDGATVIAGLEKIDLLKIERDQKLEEIVRRDCAGAISTARMKLTAFD